MKFLFCIPIKEEIWIFVDRQPFKSIESEPKYVADRWYKELKNFLNQSVSLFYLLLNIQVFSIILLLIIFSKKFQKYSINEFNQSFHLKTKFCFKPFKLFPIECLFQSILKTWLLLRVLNNFNLTLKCYWNLWDCFENK